jgi:rubrerythrin
VAKRVIDEKDALCMAMNFERETLSFFFDLRDMVSDADREVINRIIDEEKSHLQRLAAML